MAQQFRFKCLTEPDPDMEAEGKMYNEKRNMFAKEFASDSTMQQNLRKLRNAKVVLPHGGKPLMDAVVSNYVELSAVKPLVRNGPSKNSSYAKTQLKKVVSLLLSDSYDPKVVWELLGEAFRHMPHSSMPREDAARASIAEINRVTAEDYRLKAAFLFKYSFYEDSYRDAHVSLKILLHHPTEHSEEMSSWICWLLSLMANSLVKRKEYGEAVKFLVSAEKLLRAKYANCADNEVVKAAIEDFFKHKRSLEVEVKRKLAEPPSDDGPVPVTDREMDARMLAFRRQKQQMYRSGPLARLSDAVMPKRDPKSPTGFTLEATRDIKPGEIISIQRPLVHALERSHQNNRCMTCLELIGHDFFACYTCTNAVYCSDECLRAEGNLHRHDCSVLNSLRALSDGQHANYVLLFLLIAQYDVNYWICDADLALEIAGRPLKANVIRPPWYPHTEYEKMRQMPVYLKNRSTNDIFQAAVSARLLLNCLEDSYLTENCSPKVKSHLAMVLLYHILAAPKCAVSLTAAGIVSSKSVIPRPCPQATHGEVSAVKQPDDSKAESTNAEQQSGVQCRKKLAVDNRQKEGC